MDVLFKTIEKVLCISKQHKKIFPSCIDIIHRQYLELSSAKLLFID